MSLLEAEHNLLNQQNMDTIKCSASDRSHPLVSKNHRQEYSSFLRPSETGQQTSRRKRIHGLSNPRKLYISFYLVHDDRCPSTCVTFCCLRSRVELARRFDELQQELDIIPETDVESKIRFQRHITPIAETTSSNT